MHIQVKKYQYNAIITIAQLILFSYPFFRTAWSIEPNYLFMLVLMLTSFAFVNAILSLLFNRLTTAWLMPLIFLISSSALYFINNYGIYIDNVLISTVLQTNTVEAKELFSYKLLFYIVLLGVVPAYILHKVLETNKLSFFAELRSTLFTAAASLILLITVILSFYKFAPFFRENRNIRDLLIPMNYIVATVECGIAASQHVYTEIVDIAPDAVKVQTKNHKLVVMVIGEAARAQSFSLNGYGRDTNAMLTHDVLNFSNVSSCGTATAVSVPCMFSHLPRSQFNLNESRGHYNLVDILNKNNINIAWVDNNLGCQGVCKRLENVVSICDDERCYDEMMLEHIATNVKPGQDNFIILHQIGSHGPTYHLRVPEQFKKYTPTCDTADIYKCSSEELINAYDNTIYYTSHFLNEVIKITDRYSDQFDTAVIYASDHGQSTGENGVYLHGFPYMVAPKEQTHIPMLIWLSKQFIADNNVDVQCIQRKEHIAASHDDLFHTLLNLFSIKTVIYDHERDLLGNCR